MLQKEIYNNLFNKKANIVLLENKIDFIKRYSKPSQSDDIVINYAKEFIKVFKPKINNTTFNLDNVKWTYAFGDDILELEYKINSETYYKNFIVRLFYNNDLLNIHCLIGDYKFSFLSEYKIKIKDNIKIDILNDLYKLLNKKLAPYKMKPSLIKITEYISDKFYDIDYISVKHKIESNDMIVYVIKLILNNNDVIQLTMNYPYNLNNLNLLDTSFSISYVHKDNYIFSESEKIFNDINYEDYDKNDEKYAKNICEKVFKRFTDKLKTNIIINTNSENTNDFDISDIKSAIKSVFGRVVQWQNIEGDISADINNDYLMHEWITVSINKNKIVVHGDTEDHQERDKHYYEEGKPSELKNLLLKVKKQIEEDIKKSNRR